MSSSNNDAKNNDGKNNSNNNGKNVHLKFALVAAILGVGILAVALTAGQAINTAVAQTDSKQGEISTNAVSSDIVPPYPYHYPGSYQAPSTVSTSGMATTKVKPDK